MQRNKAAAMTTRSTPTSSPRSRGQATKKAATSAALQTRGKTHRTAKLVTASPAEMPATLEVVERSRLRAVHRDSASAAGALDRIGAVFTDAGVSDIQEMVMTSLQRIVLSTISIPWEVAACKSLSELADKQQQYVWHGFHEWLTVGQEVLMANRRLMDRAIHSFEPY